MTVLDDDAAAAAKGIDSETGLYPEETEELGDTIDAAKAAGGLSKGAGAIESGEAGEILEDLNKY